MSVSEYLLKNYQKVNRYKDELMTAGGFYQLPVVAKYSKQIAADIISDNNISSVLDFGANDCNFKKYVPPSCRYYSLDQDESFQHSFRDIDEVGPEIKFAMIAMFGVIEHISKKEYLDRFIPFFTQHLTANGYLVITSNNIFHNLGIRTDYSHVTSYSPRDLHAIMRNFDFETIGVYRISLMPRYFRWFFDLLSRTLFNPYGLDYCPEICWVFRFEGLQDADQAIV